MTFRGYRSWVAAVGVALLWGGAPSNPAAAQSTEANKISIEDFMFAPNPLTIKAGATVTWVNMDDEPHTVVSNTAMFRSGALDTKESFSFKFTAPGTYHFTCSIHPRMVGTIIVQ
jgi:plastocyanin